MDLVMGTVPTSAPHVPTPVLPSMFRLLNQVDQCLARITTTGALGLTQSTATLSLLLTQLFDTTIILTSDRHTFNVIFDDPQHKFNLTGCLIENTFSNILHPDCPTYIIALNRQLIKNSDDLVATIDDYL
ncbi:hypothetical protein [Lactiplantibacillus songbeiensis]|uniref:Uncharacterized protein n=1 Tax=Lactiplantibacillus songbeiensis TaxID=2559920 RepID=A0ABW4BXM5_9LACO|nr:hypothetical protein [Lactiplantibacillus songbeiensis]